MGGKDVVMDEPIAAVHFGSRRTITDFHNTCEDVFVF